MAISLKNHHFSALNDKLSGELHYDEVIKKLYATDASAYRELPVAVAMPQSENDIVEIIRFAAENDLSIIPRAAGTSLAGQVVGNGIVVDISKHMTSVLEVNQKESWVKVQPGVIRDDLNRYLKQHNLYFGPETSTANRAMIAGMVGNNSCGSNSVVYGSTREHVLELKGFLSDGSEVTFGQLSKSEFEDKLSGKTCQSELEHAIYENTYELLSQKINQKLIIDNYPDPAIPRRNTGYALDLLMDSNPFGKPDKPFNMCKLICGSEGTLMFITEIKLHVDPLPPAEEYLVCAHFDSINDALEANLIALHYAPRACELMDHYILECTKSSIKYSQNRFFVKGDPKAILAVDLSRPTQEEAERAATEMIREMKASNLGYHFPVVHGADAKKVWGLRKAGLGLLSNIPGDAKPQPVIEDTAVAVKDLPAYIREFNEITHKYGLSCVHYAHAGSGELHLRPILNMKTEEGTKLFRTIAEEIAALVKKYKGSLSGEHGDGRLRGEFIKYMVGDDCYKLIEETKRIWDPKNIFNPAKIVDTAPMDTSLRYQPGQVTPEIETIFDFSEYKGIVRSAELCNGSGDCRKTHLSGGTMCPSFMATRNEKDTTRARANILREVLNHSEKDNKFDSGEIKEVLDLCLSCKGCKSECPSNVDMAKLKAEFLQHYYEANGIPLRTKLVANITNLNKVGISMSGLFNIVNNLTITKRITGFTQERSTPRLYKHTLRSWFKKQETHLAPANSIKTVHLFCDEFTNFNDVVIGMKAIQLLSRLNYKVVIPKHEESGRTYLSKGLVKKARSIASNNVRLLSSQLGDDDLLVGIEPSAILTFRDEYIDLLRDKERDQAVALSKKALLIDEFISNEFEEGNISPGHFHTAKGEIKLHGHCHQKALASVVPTKKMLAIPANYTVQVIPSGCCGMAGSFGYEKEHYELSMQIGELVLFPAVREADDNVIIAAPGTSCRHQIKDGTDKEALHPVEILYNALKE